MKSHIELAAQAVSKAGVLNEIEPDELVEIMQHAQIEPKDMDKLASTVVYIRKRFIEKNSRYAAFKVAFKDRCIPQEDTSTPFPNTKPGEVSRTTIEIKAKRLEQSQLYTKVVALLQTNLYISYAMDRMAVLDRVLSRVMSANISDRDLGSLSKTFLEETRKPDSAAGMEVNINFGEDEGTMKSIEEKLSDVAKLMSGKTADEIIDVLALPKETVDGNN
jgi:hypothetical protein